MREIALKGDIWNNDDADILRFCGWRDIVCPLDIEKELAIADGDDVTILINSRGGDMMSGNEIKAMLRNYGGKTIARYMGYGASSATLVAAGCQIIQSEPGALLCYHNPSSDNGGDYQAHQNIAESLQNARDCALESYLAHPGCASREKLIELMDKDIFISPTKAKDEYGLIDEILPGIVPESDTGTLVAAAGMRLLITADMRKRYADHKAEESQDQLKARRALSRIRSLASY